MNYSVVSHSVPLFFSQLDLITDLLGTPPLSAMASACEGARAHILRGPHKPPSLSVLYMLSDGATHEAVHLLCRMLVFDPAKRISGSDALSHPYLDEGRLRYHTCMCKCCYSVPSGRVYTRDFEPPAERPFSHNYEQSMHSVWQGKELIHRFITEHQQGKRVPLCINPQSAAFKTFIRSTAWHSSKVSKKEERWGGFWEMWIIGASMRWRWRWFLMDSQHSFQFHMGISLKSTSTPLMNNASDAAEKTLLYRLRSRITGTRISHKKRISWIVEFWLNEPTSKLCNTNIWNNANDKTTLTMISLRDEMTVPMSP